MKLLVLLVLVLLSAGCSASTINFDPRFSPQQQLEIARGVDLWPAPLLGTGTYHFVAKDDIGALPGGEPIVGQWKGGGVIWLLITQDINTLAKVTSHEVGHSLGLRHVDDRPSIMHTTTNESTDCPTTEDIKMAVMLRGIVQ